MDRLRLWQLQGTHEYRQAGREAREIRSAHYSWLQLSQGATPPRTFAEFTIFLQLRGVELRAEPNLDASQGRAQALASVGKPLEERANLKSLLRNHPEKSFFEIAREYGSEPRNVGGWRPRFMTCSPTKLVADATKATTNCSTFRWVARRLIVAGSHGTSRI